MYGCIVLLLLYVTSSLVVNVSLISAPRTRAEEQVAFAQELTLMGATIYEAVHERTGKNAKELNVETGDIVQVLDKSRNWWKLKNYQGDTGYAPYTILKEYQPRDDFGNISITPT